MYNSPFTCHLEAQMHACRQPAVICRTMDTEDGARVVYRDEATGTVYKQYGNKADLVSISLRRKRMGIEWRVCKNWEILRRNCEGRAACRQRTGKFRRVVLGENPRAPVPALPPCALFCLQPSKYCRSCWVSSSISNTSRSLTSKSHCLST